MYSVFLSRWPQDDGMDGVLMSNGYLSFIAGIMYADGQNQGEGDV